MRVLPSTARVRQLQKTLKNLRVSLFCFLLTFLVLRNTIGAGKFGTPAQDFEEIRQHLHHVGLHRKHARVLAEVGEEESPRDPSLMVTASLLTQVRKGNVEEAIASGHKSIGDYRVLLVTGSTSSSCENPAGEHFLLKSLKNKVDYSRLHGFDVFYSDFSLGTSVSRASLLRELMNKHPHIEWLWWVNAEIVITDMAFELPLLNYTGSNIVLVGSDEAITHEGRSTDFHMGSFLIRNSQWSLDFLHNWTRMGTAETDEVLTKENWDKGVPWTRELFVEKASFLRGHWRRTSEKFEKEVVEPDKGKLPFMTHLVGCNPCGKVGDMEMEECIKHMEKTLDLVDNQVMRSGFHQKKLSSS